MAVTYDTGALIAADRGERRLWARHRALLEHRQVPTVPAPVLAQGWRGGSRQALLARLLAGCKVEPLDDDQARRVGTLAAHAGASDVVDATVVEGARRRGDVVISSDPEDLCSIADAVGYPLHVQRP
jgi:PIN domain-containing protein